MLRPSFEQNKAPRHGPYIHARFFLKCAFFLEMRVFPLCALFFAQMKVQAPFAEVPWKKKKVQRCEIFFRTDREN